MNKIALTCATIAVVGGCTSGPPPTPVDVNFTTSQARENVATYDTVEVRTQQAQTRGGGRNEVIGVPCTMRGSGYTASFQTPAVVNVPTYGYSSRALQVSCAYAGRSQSATRTPINLTEQQIRESQRRATDSIEDAEGAEAIAGAVGAVIVAATAANRRNRESDVFGYDDITLRFLIDR